MRTASTLARQLALGLALIHAPGPASRAAEASSREVYVRRSVAIPDASTREIFLRRSVVIADASTREVFLLRSLQAADAISRELVIFRSTSAQSVISREVSLGFVAQVSVGAGFIMREFTSLPTGPAHWMSLEVQPEGGDHPLDLFVASTTRQFGTPGDAPDDFIHRIDRGTLSVTLFAALDSSETDPADLAFSPFDGGLYVTARHRDGYAPGDAGGAILRVAGSGGEEVLFSNAAVAHSPLALATPAAGSGFAEGLYVGNDLAQAPSVFALSTAGAQLPYTASVAGSLGAIAFAPGNAFGDRLFVGGDDGVVRVATVAGTVSSFSAPLGAGVQGLAFSTGYEFGEMLYALLADGRVVRLTAAGTSEPFLDGLLIEPLSNDVVRNDLQFTPAGDVLYVTDARRGKVYGVQSSPPTGIGGGGPALSRPVLALGSYPNPFNPATTIRFELAAAQAVDLTVYDASGRLVCPLLRSEQLDGGMHHVKWDGRDLRGQRVASGVYVARLRTRERVQSHKLVLVK